MKKNVVVAFVCICGCSTFWKWENDFVCENSCCNRVVQQKIISSEEIHYPNGTNSWRIFIDKNNYMQPNSKLLLVDVAINKVKEKHPKAEVNRDGALFFCHEGLKDLGAGFSKEAAWKSAACNI